jgi:ribosomal protein L12E/L44/L45/RPP1/RPP2
MSDHDDEIDIRELSGDEIRELLLDAGAEISDAETEQLVALISDAGGIDEALAALSQLAPE